MKITILCVGKIKEKFYTDAVSEYMKRLSRYGKPEIIEVADEKTPDRASEVQVEQIKKKEADRLLDRMKPDAYTITLEIQGKKMDSVAFAGLLEKAGGGRERAHSVCNRRFPGAACVCQRTGRF